MLVAVPLAGDADAVADAVYADTFQLAQFERESVNMCIYKPKPSQRGPVSRLN